MKATIFLLVFLVSFSFLQSQVQTIDFIMLDGTKNQMPIDQIDTMRFEGISSNSILEVNLKNNNVKRYYCFKIDKLILVDSINKILLISKSAIWWDIDSIQIKEIDFIRIAYQFSRTEVTMKGLSRKLKTTKNGYDMNGAIKINDTSYKKETDDFGYLLQNISFNKSRSINYCNCPSIVPRDILINCIDSNITILGTNGQIDNMCLTRKIMVYFNTVNSIIDSINYEYTYYRTYEPGFGTSWIYDYNTSEKIKISSIPYIIDNDGEIVGIIYSKDFSSKIFYNYTSTLKTDGSGTQVIDETTIENFEPIDSTAKIEIKIYK